MNLLPSFFCFSCFFFLDTVSPLLTRYSNSSPSFFSFKYLFLILFLKHSPHLHYNSYCYLLTHHSTSLNFSNYLNYLNYFFPIRKPLLDTPLSLPLALLRPNKLRPFLEMAGLPNPFLGESLPLSLLNMDPISPNARFTSLS